MKKIAQYFLISLFIFGINFTFGQVSESFSNLPTNSLSAYQLRDWIGDDGFAWQADNARVDQTMFGKAITIRGNNGYLKNNGGPIPNGCGTLEFSYARIFGGNSTIQVWINGTQIGANITVSSTSPTLYSNVLNIVGNIDIEIRNITNGRRVKIDNLTWGAFPPLPTITVPPCNIFASNVTLGSQNFEIFPPLFNLPYASTNTSFTSAIGPLPFAPRFVSLFRGIEVNNANGEIIFDVIDATILANIEFTIRLASFSGSFFGNGSDVADKVRISISEDNGATYSRELTVSGRSNAR